MAPEKSDSLPDIAVRTAALANDPAFEASDRLKSLLTYLGQRAGEGARVMQADIARDVMALGPDFDPQLDAHVRIEVGRLRKALELHYARHGGAHDGRITIPKGSYRPALEPAQGPLPAPDAPRPFGPVLSVFTGLTTASDIPVELAELAAGELRAHCFMSPLSRARLMAFTVRAVDRAEDIDRLAKEAASDLALCVKIYRTGEEARVLLDLTQTGSGAVILSQRLSFDFGSEPADLARKVARGVANILCDPIFGLVPPLAARHADQRDLAVVLSAYRFMATQKTDLIPDVMAGLEHLSASPDAAPALKALFAEISRVNSWITARDMRKEAYRCLSLAEDAIGDDPTDLTCRIALGYNRLNAGLIEAALHTGTTILSSPAPTSLIHMTRMLVAIADTEGQHRDTLAHVPFEDETPFFMKEFADVIPMIRWSEIGEAERRLANSLFPNVFWLHVFHAAVLVEAGERKRAGPSIDRLRNLLPNCEARLKNMILGCFPKENESSYLLRGLRKSGLKLA